MTASDEGFVSLRTTGDEHHARLLPHVDRLLSLAESIGHVIAALSTSA